VTSARRLLVVTSRFPYGSQEAYLCAELNELARHFERITVVPVRPPAGPPRHAVPAGVDVLAWPLLDANLLRRATAALSARPRTVLGILGQMLRSRDCGRLKNATVALKGLALAQWATEHRIDHIHAYWLSTPATVAMVAAVVADIPWSSTAHRWDIYERNAFDVKARSVSFVRTISTRGATDLAERMPALDRRIIPLHLGTVLPPVPQHNAAPRSDFRIVCPAALVPVKGHTDLLAALARLRARGVPVRCTLCGVGPLQSQLEAEAAQLGLSDVVEFAGFVPQERLHSWYRSGRFAACVLASRAAGVQLMEGIPSALIEAMAFGVPVVATNSGSVGELVDRRFGHLVKPQDPDALADALFDVYANGATALECAERAYARVAQRHDVVVQMEKLAAALGRKEARA
jgi:colanic acid/amylovoran biosynthesis glycosyltransferase